LRNPRDGQGKKKLREEKKTLGIDVLESFIYFGGQCQPVSNYSFDDD